ncbi:TfoX/Sxy family protein [Actinokineospora fastidiosa]|uniref:TfoX N-terminal domain-containing protein n=1 Tax=Actinokineospora fastidiosa TaxID=1816 RepID=A0A918GKV0_9PSEU|nr:TfoX/Sxy family protein [Actinokineospora fastidiosa]GGS43351.1 hypothetical protein GCM10010171_43080 [Actinokineospora fastidiosa]
MAYDRVLAERVRELLAGVDGITEQPMFGGLAFLVNGNMAVAASGQGGLLVRVPRDETGGLLGEHVEVMVMGGREMVGWLHVDGAGLGDRLAEWVGRGVGCARSLPAKAGKAAVRRR